jgi:hypothetical protein
MPYDLIYKLFVFGSAGFGADLNINIHQSVCLSGYKDPKE